jgi:hypothetical protein
MNAPWVENAEVEAAEDREARRAALRKAIAAKQTQRTNRRALAARETKESAGEGGGGIEGALSQLDPSQINSAMLQSAAAKLGIPASQIPNRRTLLRKLGNLSAAELMAASAAKR